MGMLTEELIIEIGNMCGNQFPFSFRQCRGPFQQELGKVSDGLSSVFSIFEQSRDPGKMLLKFYLRHV